MVATAAVNVRSGPGTGNPVIGTVWPGQVVTSRGEASAGWVPVTYQGRPGWMSASYLRSAGASGTVALRSSSSRHTRGTTIAALNVRSGAGITHRVVTVLPRGAGLTLTGRTLRGWDQINLGGRLLWVNSAWVRTRPVGRATLPRARSAARATTELMIRTAPGPRFRNLGDIPRGTVLQLTGRSQQGVSQVIWRGSLRWVNARFLAPLASSTTPVPPAAPRTIGSRYATTALNVRTSWRGPGMVGEVPRGTRLRVTGVVRNGRAQVVLNGATRWVTAMYLSTRRPYPARTLTGSLNTAGSSGLDQLAPRAKRVVLDVRATYPQIATMYGVRPDPLPDHPSGRAVDVMVPNYRANKALGWQVARHMQVNASRLGINYVIFDQRIWSVARSSEGWRPMADRCDDNANHKNHVHVTMN